VKRVGVREIKDGIRALEGVSVVAFYVHVSRPRAHVFFAFPHPSAGAGGKWTEKEVPPDP